MAVGQDRRILHPRLLELSRRLVGVSKADSRYLVIGVQRDRPLKVLNGGVDVTELVVRFGDAPQGWGEVVVSTQDV